MKLRNNKDIIQEMGALLLLGLLCFAAGVFFFVDSRFVHTLPYDELTEATVVVQEVKVSYGKYSLFYIVDTQGNEYNVDGDFDRGLEMLLQPDDVIAIRYQPAYYRLRNGIQELCLNGERLVTYRNDDAVSRIGFPILGGVMVLFAGLMCAMATLEMRREARRRNKRNIKLRRKYGDKAKTQ